MFPKKIYKAEIFFYTDTKVLNSIKDYVARRKELGEPLTKEQIKTLLLHRRKELIVRRETVLEEDKKLQKLIESSYHGDLSNEDFTKMINNILKDITGRG